MMRFASLGSGSEGNALVVQAGATTIMLDCGFNLSETISRLERIGLAASQLDGILVTHEHDDHVGGVSRVSRKFDIPVYLTHGTLSSLGPARAKLPQVTIIDSHTPFAIGDIEVFPYPVPHDAREPSQFVLSDGARRLGVLTDAGSITPHIEQMLSGLDALVLECNHDRSMLMSGSYPYSLKQRIGGRFGHLANETAAGLLGGVDYTRLQHCIAAHLSRQNNTPDLARAALAVAMQTTADWICVATQEEGFAWRQIA
jgi:phosphoribosyl 1,2-cyclic phosphodiesterase